MKSLALLFISSLFAPLSWAQYSSANQNTSDNESSNNYQSGYVNEDYSKEKHFEKPKPQSESGFEDQYNFYDNKQREVERIFPPTKSRGKKRSSSEPVI